MSDLNKIAILIVEDEALIAEDIKDICELAGYEVTYIAYRAGQAINALDKQHFDLALLDVNLEDELSGIDIAQYITSKHKNIPCIFLTSYADTKTLNAAKDAQPMGYIVKPFNKAQLVSTIEISLYNFSRFKMPNGLNQQAIEKKFNVSITEREYEILTLLCEGKTNQQMAERLYLSINTIKYHIKHLYDKLHVGSRTQLMAILGR
jgi:two-component system, response regulator PdtaR